MLYMQGTSSFLSVKAWIQVLNLVPEMIFDYGPMVHGYHLAFKVWAMKPIQPAWKSISCQKMILQKKWFGKNWHMCTALRILFKGGGLEKVSETEPTLELETPHPSYRSGLIPE